MIISLFILGGLISPRTTLSAPFSLLRTLAADAKTKAKGSAAPPTPPVAAAAVKKEAQVAKPKQEKAPKATKEPKEPKEPRKLLPWGEQETTKLLRLAERFGEFLSAGPLKTR